MAMPSSSSAALLAGVLFLSTSFEVSAVLRSRQRNRSTDGNYVPTVYVYDIPEFTITNNLGNCEEEQKEWPTYVDVLGPLQKQLASHPRRAASAAEADWKIVPFDFDLNEMAGVCNGTTPEQRVNTALDTLESMHLFKKSGGEDHIIIAMRHRIWPPNGHDQANSYFPKSRRHLLRKMVVGHYQDHHLNLQDEVYGFEPVADQGQGWLHNGADWRCTWLLPVQSAEGLWKADESYDTWAKRPHPIFFRGHFERCRSKGAEDLRESTSRLKHVVPHALINNSHADTFDQYVEEITNSKFCLVMRCDDPQTSRFVDSLAAGCIPVFVSEGLNLVAKPFSQMINYDTFSVSIDEATWMQDTIASAHFAYLWPDHQLSQMHAALEAARTHILWNHPRSQAATMALRELQSSCAV